MERGLANTRTLFVISNATVCMCKQFSGFRIQMLQRDWYSLGNFQGLKPQMSQGMEKREHLSPQLFPPDYPNSFELDALSSKHST